MQGQPRDVSKIAFEIVIIDDLKTYFEIVDVLTAHAVLTGKV